MRHGCATVPATPGGGAAGPLRRLGGKTREVGPAYAAYLGLRRAIPGWLGQLDWFSVYERAPVRGRPSPRAGEEIRWGGPEDLPALAGLGWPESALAERIERGDRVCLLARDGEVLAYWWVRSEVHDESGLRLTLAGDERWGLDALVAASARGRGLGPRLLRSASADLADAGVTRVLSSVDTLNRNMLKVLDASGARRLGSVLAIRVAGLRLIRERGPAGTRWRAARARRPIPYAVPRPGDAS
jgi:ribosomal protein S18 acetylase RimI-like enzyme